MIATKLLLIEGPPGSGKSTTAQKINDEITRAGIPSRCYLEWCEDHPIAIGADLELTHVVNTALLRKEEMFLQWQQFASDRQSKEGLTVLESRFWQTSVMLMYAAGSTEDEIRQYNGRVVDTLKPLNPVLIQFVITDIKTFTTAVILNKEKEWQQAGLVGSWAGHIYDALDHQPWFRKHGVSGLTGYCAFLAEWAAVADRLYAQFPYPKMQLLNPYLDWDAAMTAIRSFLELDSHTP